MPSKYILPTILFAIIIVNSFGLALDAQFGCHNFSSIDKITSMSSNNNKLLRNLMQCMRDTGTYDEENLEIAKKLQSDFESAQKDTWSDIFYRDVPIGITILSNLGLFMAEAVLMENNRKKLSIMGVTYLGGITAIVYVINKQESYVYRQKEKRKEPIAIDTKNFVDILQKKISNNRF